MKEQNHLGIYFSKDIAIAIYLDLHKANAEHITDSFKVSAAESEQSSIQLLAELIAKGCLERNWAFSEISVALDCSMFMQHSIHSEFSDIKQITSTVQFDTEEVLATDVTDIALAFEVNSSDDTGSNLTVFTAQKQILSEILASLQQNNLDPICIEPDVKCLSRFIKQQTIPEANTQNILYCIISGRSGYMIMPTKEGPSNMRTFLIGSTTDKTSLLKREFLINSASIQSDESITSFKVFDPDGEINTESLSEQLGIETTEIEWLESDGSPDNVNTAIAHGAALSNITKDNCVNFRDDFSPFQGKKVKMQKALKFAAVSVTLLFIALGMYLQTQIIINNRDIRDLHNKFGEVYSEVMHKQLPENKSINNAILTDLNPMLNGIKKESQGVITNDQTVSAKLSILLSAINKCAAKTDLVIDKITITLTNIDMSCTTTSRDKTMAFYEVIEESGLVIKDGGYKEQNGLDIININMIPES